MIGNKKIKSVNLIENKSQKYKNSSPIQLTMSKSLVSPSTPISNSLFQQQELRKKMSNSISMTELKVTSLCGSSTNSLVSTQLLAAAYNQTKPNVVITNTTPPGINKAKNSPYLSTTTSSILPHFSSKSAMLNVSKIQTVVAPTSTNENIQDLIDQLKSCIAKLNLLLQNKTEDEKQIISNVKSYSDEKKSRTKKKPSESSLTATPDCLIFSKKSMSDEKNLVFEDITVRRCKSSNNQGRKSMIDLF
jgi:hypothetical protein